VYPLINRVAQTRGHSPGFGRADQAGENREAKRDGRARPGRGDETAVFHYRLGGAERQFGFHAEMAGVTAARQQAGVEQHRRSGANGRHHAACGGLGLEGRFNTRSWQTWADRPRHKGPGHPALICGGLAAAFLLVAIGVLLRQGSQGWIAYAGDHPGSFLHAQFIRDVAALCAQRPWFGWGQYSFGVAFSFFQQADLGLVYRGYVRSDLLQSVF